MEYAATACGWVGATSTAVGLLPQMVKSLCFDGCQMENVSMGTLLLSCLSSYATLAYAVYYQLPPIMLSNGGCAAMATCLTLMKARDMCCSSSRVRRCCAAGHDEEASASTTSCEDCSVVVEQGARPE